MIIALRYKNETYICEKIVIHAVHERGTIVNYRNIMQVKNKKKYLGKLYALKFLVLSEISYLGIFISILSCEMIGFQLSFLYFKKLILSLSFIRLINHRTVK